MSDLSSTDAERTIFQRDAVKLREGLQHVLGEAYGDVWLGWAKDTGRLKVAVTTRCDHPCMAAAEQVIEDSSLRGRVDLVRVTWSARELREGQERLVTVLGSSVETVRLVAVDPQLNSVVLWTTGELSQADANRIKLAIQAAAVSVRVLVNDLRWQASDGSSPRGAVGWDGAAHLQDAPAIAASELDTGEGVPVVLTVRSCVSDGGRDRLLSYELANRAPTCVRFGAEFGLQQDTESGWVALNVGTAWPAIGHRIRARQRRVSSCRLPPDWPAGRYRLHKDVGVEIEGARERGLRPLHERFRLTADFTIS
jgi:hypothetical protein